MERFRVKEATAIAATVAHREALAKAKAAKAASEASGAEVADGGAAGASASASDEAGAPAGELAEGASVWNRGGYHWEERDLTAWAKERLTALLEAVEVDVPGGLLKVVEVKELKGDASSSVRKGAKRVFFEFKAKLAWEGEIIDGKRRGPRRASHGCPSLTQVGETRRDSTTTSADPVVAIPPPSQRMAPSRPAGTARSKCPSSTRTRTWTRSR